ncbi:MAG TPA: hypothetical protein VGG36_00885 [Rhizomicrobium sp.]|jgi:hypothetical protein
MLKFTLAASAAVAAIVAFSAPSFAATDTISISGVVSAKCSVANATQSITLSNIDTPDGTYAGEALPESIGDIWCNGTGNSVQITAKPITTSNSTTDTPFINRIDYVLSATSPSVFAALPPLSTVNAPASGAMATLDTLPAFDTGASHSTYTMTTQSTGGNKLIAGTYTGEIDVLVTPGT